MGRRGTESIRKLGAVFSVHSRGSGTMRRTHIREGWIGIQRSANVDTHGTSWSCIAIGAKSKLTRFEPELPHKEHFVWPTKRLFVTMDRTEALAILRLLSFF